MARWRVMQSTKGQPPMGDRHWREVLDPNGVPAEVGVKPAARIVWWSSSFQRTWATLTNDQSWWVDVQSVYWPIVLAREAYPTEAEALARADVLAADYVAGRLHPRRPHLVRRRPRS